MNDFPIIKGVDHTDIEHIPVGDLIPYARNSRTHSDEQVNQIVASLNEWGFTNPLLLDENNQIIAGHGRLMAAKKAGYEKVPCMVAKGWTEAQKKAYVIADNKLALNSGWDDEMLAVEFQELEELGFNIELTGFDIGEIEELMPIEEVDGLTDEDEVPELPEEPISKLGDVWILGNHRLMCGDSTSVDDVEKLMNGNKADMVFTDPPYGMFLDADYSSMDSKFKGSSGGNSYENVIGDHSDFDPSLINTVFANFSYCKEVFLWGADYYAEHLPDKNNGSWVVWDKRGDESADKMFGSTFELCWSKAKHKRMLARVKWAGIFGMEKEHDKKRAHPTQKPVAIIDWFFDYYSLKDKVNVVDLYGGSGSTLLSCEKAGKSCFMSELDEKYVDVIINRWQDYTGKEAVLESTKQSYNELKQGAQADISEPVESHHIQEVVNG
jgi:ParB-like chromosome segregation protein Spo0J